MPHFQRKKKTVKGSVGKNIEYLCKMSGFISRNRRARLDFWVVHVQHSRLRIVITFQCRLDFEREVGHLVLVIRCGSPDYLRQTSYKHALKYLEAARWEKKQVKQNPSYGKRLTIVDLFEGLWLIGTDFRR